MRYTKAPTERSFWNVGMHILLAPVGSHGDVHPFIGLGMGLQARGHRVTLIASEIFGELAVRHGFEFAPTVTRIEYERTIANPDLWHPKRSARVIFDDALMRKYLPIGYEQIRKRYVPQDTVLLAGPLSLPARVAHDKLGIPLATVHLAPIGLFSAVETSIYPTIRMRSWWPAPWKRTLFWMGERFSLDPLVRPQLNAFRATLDLPPVRRVLGKWIHSPQLVLGLFPDWFGHAPDWPAQVRTPGFIRYDQADTKPVPESVEAFLNAGDAPVVFSFGSAMRTGRSYFEAAVEACRTLGRRGLFLAKATDQIPPNLPPTILQADYVPFSAVFTRAAAVVHHGGIGTTAQALAAGVPQVIMPMSFDQPDNAERLRKLGVARVVPAAKFTGPTLTAALRDLSADPRVPGACADLQERLRRTDPMRDACDRIEGLRGTDTV